MIGSVPRKKDDLASGQFPEVQAGRRRPVRSVDLTGYRVIEKGIKSRPAKNSNQLSDLAGLASPDFAGFASPDFVGLASPDFASPDLDSEGFESAVSFVFSALVFFDAA